MAYLVENKLFGWFAWGLNKVGHLDCTLLVRINWEY